MAMLRQVKAGVGALVALYLPAHAMAQDGPTAQQILFEVRQNQTEQHREVEGQLRVEDRVMPFRLTFNGEEIRYAFTNPPQTLILKLGESGSQLFDQTKGSAQKISPARFDEKVRDTDIAYEDLALRFLYWPKARIDGEELKLTRRCWKLHLEPATRTESSYAVVLLWVDKESGAFLQAEAYGADGKIKKRFKITSSKQMRIEELSGLNSRDKSPTYLEIQKR
ncbi:MAG: hypothetical protein QOD99_2416 [Chthoniobacter sp.]|jgi:hypothetical protein|nr:hypothetical protein [Chthoniobacter sp.]